MAHPAAPRGPFAAFAQRVGQTLDDGAVDVGPGVNVAKTDHGALRFRPRDLDPRRPVGLEDEPHRARRHRLHQFVEEVFGLDPAFFGNPSLAQTELLFEPRDHPITTIDLHLEAVGAGHRRRKGRQHGHRFDIAPVGGVDGGAGAVAQTCYPGIEAARTEHLAGLVGGRGDQRQPRRDTSSRRGGRRDLAQYVARRHQIGQQLAGHRQGPPLPVARRGPPELFVIEGHITHLAAGRIHESTHQSMGQKAGEEQILVGARPDLGLVDLQPVGIGLGLKMGHGLAHPHRAEGQTPDTPHRLEPLTPALVEPENGRTQRIAGFIDVDHGRALGREPNRRHRFSGNRAVPPQRLARLAEPFPHRLWVLFSPTGVVRIIGVDLHPGFGNQVPSRVEKQRPHALRAVVDGQQMVS